MPLFIARHRGTFAHYFFRVVDSSILLNSKTGDQTSLLNSLISAKSHKQVAAAIENAPLLINCKSSLQPARTMTPPEAIEALRSDFEPTDSRLLAFEMFLASPKPLRANSSKNSPAAELDAYKNALPKFLSEIRSDIADPVVIVEPVQDWMTCRNALAICASLLANIESVPEDGRVLERAGFFEPEKKSFDFPCYVTPFKFQASVWMKNYIKDMRLADKVTGTDVDYLYTRYLADEGEAVPARLLTGVALTCIGQDTDVFTATHYDAIKQGLTPADLVRLPWEKNRFYYLCVKNTATQLELAKKIVGAFWRKTQQLIAVDGSPLGMVLNEENLFMPNDNTPSFSSRSLNSELWQTLCYHAGKKLIACKHCGCGMLVSGRSSTKTFCSDSCRVQEHNSK